MNSEEESAYEIGFRQAWVHMLSQCIRHLGHGILVDEARLIKEREEAILQLRSLCEEFGDNDWETNLHLADIIEKHLGRHLHKGTF